MTSIRVKTIKAMSLYLIVAAIICIIYVWLLLYDTHWQRKTAHNSENSMYICLSYSSIVIRYNDQGTLEKKEFIIGGLQRVTVHDHHSREHGGGQAGMMLEQ